MLEIDDDALLEALPEVKDIKLPKHKGRILAKKIQQKIGDAQNWDVRYGTVILALKGFSPLLQFG